MPNEPTTTVNPGAIIALSGITVGVIAWMYIDWRLFVAAVLIGLIAGLAVDTATRRKG